MYHHVAKDVNVNWNKDTKNILKLKSDHYVTLCCECLKNTYLLNKQVYIHIYTSKHTHTQDDECVL